jgi:hypothetical protein
MSTFILCICTSSSQASDERELTLRWSNRFSTKYDFAKPNDRRALDLMNAAAVAVMKELSDLVLAYGISDEYRYFFLCLICSLFTSLFFQHLTLCSFIFHKDCDLFDRRASKIMTTVVSTFTAYYVGLWSQYFPDKILTSPMPTFDGRCVCYPSVGNLRDYMSWRQVDCKPPIPSLHQKLTPTKRPHKQPLQHNLLGPNPKSPSQRPSRRAKTLRHPRLPQK